MEVMKEYIDMNLSENFTLSEFVRSETAMVNGYHEQYLPNEDVKKNLISLCLNVAEPIRTRFGSFSPTCAYRCQRTNKKVGGASNSEHLFGNAFDETFIRDGKNISREVFDWIISGGLKKWSKLILEFPDKQGVPRWLHIGNDINNLKNEVLVAEKNAFGKTFYTNFTNSKYQKH